MFERQDEDTPFFREELWMYMYLHHLFATTVKSNC